MQPLSANPQQRRTGFTLIEMLVVIAVIAILISLITPAVSRSMRAGRTTASINNLKQIHLLFTQYLTDHRQRFPFSVGTSTTKKDWPRVVWEHSFGEFTGNVADAMAASPYATTMWCPVQTHKHGKDQHPWGRSSYAMNGFFRPISWGGQERFLGRPDVVGTIEPLIVAGTRHPIDARFGTFSHNDSSRFPYDTAWSNVAYEYGPRANLALGLWIDGRAATVPREAMISLDPALRDKNDFQ